MPGFGEDARGNIWALANETGIPFEETGLVMKLVRRCADRDFVDGEPERRTPPCRDEHHGEDGRVVRGGEGRPRAPLLLRDPAPASTRSTLARSYDRRRAWSPSRRDVAGPFE